MPTPSPHSSANPFTPEQVHDLRTRLAAFPAGVRERGRAYARMGRVGRLAITPAGFTARVTGTSTYDVRWSWESRGWQPTCTCPVAPTCKHAYATADKLLGMLHPDEGIEARTADVLRAARTTWERATALRELLRERPGTSVHLHLPPFDEILDEPDPDLLCWRLARALPAATGGWIPAALDAYAPRADLRERFLDRQRELLAARLAAWSAPTPAPAGRAATPTRSLRFVFDLRRTAGDEPALVVEGRVTSPRTIDERRSPAQLQLLASEVGRKPGLLPADQVELLEAFLANLGSSWGDRNGQVVTTTTIRRLLEVGGGTAGVTWSSALEPALAERFALTPGAPVTLAPQAVHVVPCVEERDGRLVLDLEARAADGRRRALRDVLLLRGRDEGGRGAPSLVFFDHAAHVVAGQPPVDLADDLRALGGLPLDAGRDGPLLADLAQRFPTLRESLGPHARLLAARPVVALDVQDDWLLVRVFAAPADATWAPGEPREPGMRLHEFTADRRWTAVPEDPPPAGLPAPGAPAAVAAGGLELLDPVPLAPIVEWLGHSGLTARADAWALRLGAKALAAFDDAWAARPRDARWYSTPAARRLLDEPRRIHPTLSVRPSGMDWFSVTATWESEDLALSDADLALLRRGTERYVRLSTGWARRDTGEAIERAAGVLADLGLEAGAGEQRVSLWQLAQARPESLVALEEYGGTSSAEAAQAIAGLRQRVQSFRGLPRIPIPATFQGELRPYQRDGVDFLAFASTLDLGAVLADDMGLGKTVQALAWLLWLRERTPDLGPTLVVCPASVVHNWLREAERFAPTLRAVRLTGAERRDALRAAVAEGADLLVTNYALLRMDRAALQGLAFGAVILDEAQNIKNPNTVVSRAARELTARHRLALTGTPLENRALDLWSILAFASPGFLGSRRQFSARYDSAETGPNVRRLLAARLRPVLLRRMKQQVATELPPRTEERLDCELLPIQKKLYADQLARGRALLADLRAGRAEIADHRFEILAVLTRLRQVCCHPALVGAPAAAPSGKFDALWEVLEPLLAEGHKVLLFSQFVECLKLLAREMKRRGMPTHLLTGQTQEKAREEVVRRFVDDARASVFLVSLKAGGTGLNLTAASHVVLFDPWWNPAVEAQAIDRTHRIGQTRKVTAFRLFTRGTIEEKIWELQQKKATLAREILGEEGFARSLTREDLEWLFEPA